MKLTRRSLLRATAATLATPALRPLGLGAIGAAPLATAALAQEKKWRHGLSLFGDVKYPEGFKQFDYVNAGAPQGGGVRQIATSAPSTISISRSQAPRATLPTASDSFARDTDDIGCSTKSRRNMACWRRPSAHPDDHSWVTYRLRANARWHDGMPVSAEDVIFSMNSLKNLSPQYSRLLSISHQGGKDRRAGNNLHV